MRLDKDKVKKIIELKNEGKTQLEIAALLKISQKTVSYWLSPEEKRKEISKKTYDYFKRKSLAQRREVYKRRLPYLREYFKRKYHSNEKFRLKEIERAKNAKQLSNRTKG